MPMTTQFSAVQKGPCLSQVSRWEASCQQAAATGIVAAPLQHTNSAEGQAITYTAQP